MSSLIISFPKIVELIDKLNTLLMEKIEKLGVSGGLIQILNNNNLQGLMDVNAMYYFLEYFGLEEWKLLVAWSKENASKHYEMMYVLIEVMYCYIL
jgi:hypothetical protein